MLRTLAGCNISITRNVYMIAVKGTGERGSVPDNPVVLDCASQGRNFVVGPGIQLLVEGIHLRFLSVSY